MFVWGTKQQVKHQFVQGQVQEEGRRCVHIRWCRWGRGISLYAHFLIALGCKQNVNPGLQREAPVCTHPPTPAAPDLDSSCSLLLDGGALRESCSVKLPSVRPLTKLLYLTRCVWRHVLYISVVCFNINMKKWNYFDQKIVSISYFFRRADNNLPLSEAKMEVIRRCYSAKKTRSGFPLIMAVIFPLMHLV